MTSHIKRVEVRGLHGRLNLKLDFRSDINILYGRNGTGKTTLLHILANVLNGSIERFAYLDFEHIKVTMSEDRHIEVRRTKGTPPEDDTIRLSSDGIAPYSFPPSAIRIVESSDGSETHLVSRATALSTVDGLRRTSRRLPVSGAAYFPAFRTMMEAWWSAANGLTDSVQEPWLVQSPPEGPFTRFLRSFMLNSRDRPSRLTEIARGLFGGFVPTLNYPSLLEVETELDQAAQTAAYRIATESEAILSNAFVDAVAAPLGLGDAPEMVDQLWLDIERNLAKLEEAELVLGPSPQRGEMFYRLRERIPPLLTSPNADTVAPMLTVLRDALARQVQLQRETLAQIERYVDTVNGFLDGKRLIVARTTEGGGFLRLLLEFDGGATGDLRSLSSGERQIVTLLYAASKAAPEGVVLIDEPELSLHVDWQRHLLPKMAEQLGDRQVIVCTHSPMIGADFEDHYQVVRPNGRSENDVGDEDQKVGGRELVEAPR